MEENGLWRLIWVNLRGIITVLKGNCKGGGERVFSPFFSKIKFPTKACPKVAIIIGKHLMQGIVKLYPEL